MEDIQQAPVAGAQIAHNTQRMPLLSIDDKTRSTIRNARSEACRLNQDPKCLLISTDASCKGQEHHPAPSAAACVIVDDPNLQLVDRSFPIKSADPQGAELQAMIEA